MFIYTSTFKNRPSVQSCDGVPSTVKHEKARLANVNVVKSDGSYLVELPGYTKDDIEINVIEGSECIQPDKFTMQWYGISLWDKTCASSKHLRIVATNDAYGVSVATIGVPHDADLDSIVAKVENGMLSISFPGKIKNKIKTIPLI